ncbi:Hypothetical protein A7982_08162 [Minicystis rosea]|nr:Hypothetical protein A7982_08162 [Minicystis rosea]
MLTLALVCSCGSKNEPGTSPYAVTIRGPTMTFNGAAEVSATPEPADGTTAVSFTVDGVPRAVDTEAPYAVSLDLSHDWGGVHRITAVAHRTDGAVAEASIDVTYDPLGPFVTLLAPTAGARISPKDGTFDVSFVASDPSGLGAGEVQLDGAEPVSIPLPSLSLSVPISKPIALPTTPALSWWIEDTLGNRTQGSLSLLQSYERFGVAVGGLGTVHPLPGRRLAVVSLSQVRAFEPDGSPAWALTGPPSQKASATPTTGGDLLVQWLTLQGTTEVQRLHPNGTVAWTWSSGLTLGTQRMVYVAESDSVLMLQRQGSQGSFTASLLDPTGQETHVKTYAPSYDVWPLATPPGVSPGGFALGATNGGTTAHYDVFDPVGTPAWSGDFSTSFEKTVLLTRDAIFGPLPMADGSQYGILGAGGTTADLGVVDRSLVTANGDVVMSTHTPTSNTVSRVRADGSVVWQASFGAPVTDLSGSGDRIGVTTITLLHVVDASGSVVAWAPDADPWFVDSPRAVFGPSGAFYVVVGEIGSDHKRIYRAAADGTTLWHETLFEGGDLRTESIAPDDDRLVVSMQGPTTRMHVFEP